MISTLLSRLSPTTRPTSNTTHATHVTKDATTTTLAVVAETLAPMDPALIAPPHATQPTATPKEKGKATADKKVRGRESHPPPPPASALRTPKARDPCAYCGGGGDHDARTWYKRIADEKSKNLKTHKQAIQNILIDEAAMEFSQTVLSVFLTQDTLTAEPHTIPWGGSTETTTDSDETNAEHEHENNSDTQQKDDSEKCNEPGDEDTLTSENGDSQTTQHMLTEEQRPTPPLPTIEPLPYSLESELTGVPMTASTNDSPA
jgi:hypothetical protein